MSIPFARQMVGARCDPSTMWLFTPTGFLSIVADYDVSGNALVRARVLEDLEAFCARTASWIVGPRRASRRCGRPSRRA